jgi:hypothetical protein
MKHTPGTWYEAKTGNHQGLVVDENTGENIAVIYDKADTAFIVKSCNSHEDLLEALKACKAYMIGECTELDLIQTDKLAEQAIVKAENSD